MESKNLNVRQILEYAKKNGFNSVKFSVRRNGSHLVAGKFLDAYYEFVQIPVLGDGLIMMRELESGLGYDITFDVLDEDDYIPIVRCDFIIRGKELPEKYQFDVNEE